MNFVDFRLLKIGYRIYLLSCSRGIIIIYIEHTYAVYPRHQFSGSVYHQRAKSTSLQNLKHESWKPVDLSRSHFSRSPSSPTLPPTPAFSLPPFTHTLTTPQSASMPSSPLHQPRLRTIGGRRPVPLLWSHRSRSYH